MTDEDNSQDRDKIFRLPQTKYKIPKTHITLEHAVIPPKWTDLSSAIDVNNKVEREKLVPQTIGDIISAIAFGHVIAFDARVPAAALNQPKQELVTLRMPLPQGGEEMITCTAIAVGYDCYRGTVKCIVAGQPFDFSAVHLTDTELVKELWTTAKPATGR